jgi:peptide chain release factor subunit 1
VLGKFDVSYTDESGLYDLVDAAGDVLAETEVMKDKAQMAEFFEQLHDGGKATYGFDATRQNLRMGAVDRLLISEDLRNDVVTYDCGGREAVELVDSNADTPAHTCEDGSEGEVLAREDAIDHLMELADERGSDVKFVSTDFEKGEQLLTAFGGIAAILRYSTGV